jgi:hypothetical protein
MLSKIPSAMRAVIPVRGVYPFTLYLTASMLPCPFGGHWKPFFRVACHVHGCESPHRLLQYLPTLVAIITCHVTAYSIKLSRIL